MISENHSSGELIRKFLQVLAVRNQVFSLTCAIMIATAWSDTYRLMGQIFALLMVAFLIQTKITVRFGTETNGYTTTQTVAFRLLSSAVVGLLIGAFFRAIIQTSPMPGAIDVVIPLAVSAVFFTFIPHLKNAPHADRSVSWSVYAGISFFFALAEILLLDMLRL
jgi:uncharacterized protein YacL